MTGNEYQELACRTINQDLTVKEMEQHALHGMCSEVGEIHGIYQKTFQGHEIDDDKLKKEVGDLLWFVALFCTAKGWWLEDIEKENIDKLTIRYPDGFEADRSINREE